MMLDMYLKITSILELSHLEDQNIYEDLKVLSKEVFILKTLKEFNNCNDGYYIINPLFRDDKILKLKISVKTKSGYDKITLVVSYSLLPDSLDELSKSFGSNNKKGLFPYGFVKSNRLNYIGNTPDRKYYKIKAKIIDLQLSNLALVSYNGYNLSLIPYIKDKNLYLIR